MEPGSPLKLLLSLEFAVEVDPGAEEVVVGFKV